MQEEKDENSEPKIYELGFLIVASMSEEKLPEAVSKIKAVIEEEGGLFITEEYPKSRPLSYEMAKKVDVKRTVFKQAYFGWAKFELNPERLSIIKKRLEENPEILRFLLIKTVRESTLASHRVFLKKDRVSIYKKPSEVISVETPSQEEIDKSIDKLVAS
jgi:ribosomal protein S6